MSGPLFQSNTVLPPRVLAITLTLAVFAAGVYYGILFYMRHHDADVRLAALATVQQTVNTTLTAQRSTWARERDSLTMLTHQRDTIVIESIRAVRTAIAARVDTVRDTVRSFSIVTACSTLATECDAFRVSANQTLAFADSLHRADSLRVLLLSTQHVASSDSVRTLMAQRTGRVSLLRAAMAVVFVATLTYALGRFTP